MAETDIQPQPDAPLPPTNVATPQLQPAGPSQPPSWSVQGPNSPPGSAVGSTHEGQPGFAPDAQDRGPMGNMQWGIQKHREKIVELEQAQKVQEAHGEQGQARLEGAAVMLGRGFTVPPVPLQQKVAPPPAGTTEADARNMVGFASAMALIGAIGSRYARMPAEAAMNAFSGAIKGYKEGNQAEFEKQYKLWEANTKMTLDNNKTLMDQYRAQLENNKLTWDQKRTNMETIAVVNDHRAALDMLKTKNIETIATLVDKGTEIQGKLQKQYDPMRIKEQKQAAGMPMDADTIKGMVGQWRAGDDSVTRQFGWGITGAQNRAAFWKEAIAENAAAGTSPAQQARTIQQFKADTAQQRALAVRQVNIDISAQDVENLVPLARQANHALPRSDFVPFAQLELQGSRITSNPAYIDLNSYTTALKTAYAGTMSRGSVTTVNAMTRADHVIDTAVGTAGYDRALETLQKEVDAIRKAPEQIRERLAHQFVTGAQGGGPPAPGGQGTQAAPAAPVKVQTPADAQKLTPGQHYVTPDGKEYVR